MPQRPCLVCGELTRNGSWCAAHTRKSWQNRSPSSRATARPGWNALRAEALRRDWYACVRCGSPDKLAVHHIVPVAEGGANVLGNVEVLCGRCHSAEHKSAKGNTRGPSFEGLRSA